MNQTIDLQESQNIEFKQSWRDEYIKWICAFANSDGGKLYIGIDDKTHIVGIDNAKKLLEDIPNKVRDILGLIVDVNLHIASDKEYLEIVTDKYPYPVSYKGSYYYRSGSSTQELKGVALDKFILGKQGIHWDSVPIPNTDIKDLDNRSFEIFVNKAIRSKRIDEQDIPQNYEELLDKLRLVENGYIKRAGWLLFAKDPQKYFTGAYVKIAFFESASEILYQDVCEGSLFMQVEKVIDLIFSKYLKALISYEGVQRVEEFPYEPSALREIIHNAIVHKDYSSGVPIQIGVFKDKLFVYNSGQLPENWTLKTITTSHRSQPYNPDIANVFFKAGLIESWGRGIEKVIDASKKYNGTTPLFSWDNGLNVEFYSKYPNGEELESSTKRPSKDLVKDLEKSLNQSQIKIMKLIDANPNITQSELSKEIGINDKNIRNNIKKLKDLGLLKRIGPAKGGYWEIIDE